MLVPWSWLAQWVPLDISPETLGHRLAFTGLEVESVQTPDGHWEGIVVGEVRTIDPHPNADRLVVCQVDTGDEAPRTIVCGASNMRVGDHVPVALPGARLGEITIKRSKLRGVLSEGMMCSARELGLGTDHAGLLILEKDSPVGAPATAVLGGGDTILELSVTPNRGDCLSIRGLAREVAIITGGAITTPERPLQESGPDIAGLTSVTIEDPDGCPRYACRVVQGVTVGPSPHWLAEPLRAAGLRPINNVVDATNYVMLELGQPLHAFDMDTLREGRIVVRRAVAGETIVTLDDEARALTPDMTVIADAERPVALAGVMGGLATSVTERTRNLLLESAYFTPAGIRRTAKSLRVASESSYRFERGVDPAAVPEALDRLARIIAETAGGVVARGRIDLYPAPLPPTVVQLRLRQIARVLGIPVAAADARAHLEALGCAVALEGDTLHVTVPTWRSDLTREIDLIEEVARLTGYDKIPRSLPAGEGHAEAIPPVGPSVPNHVRDLLVGAGFTEVLPYRFGPSEEAGRLGFAPDDPAAAEIRLRNPLSEDRAVMRRHILPSLLRVLAANQRNGNADVRIFEVGTIFIQTADGPVEETLLGGIVAGRRPTHGWWGKPEISDFYDAKGVVELLGEALRVPVTWDVGDRPYFRAGAQATALAGERPVGWVGEVAPDVLEHYETQGPVFAFIMQVDTLAKHVPDAVRYEAFGRFPPVRRARTYDVAEDTLAAALLEALRGVGGALLERVELTDIFRGAQVGAGRKSLTLALTFRAPDRTLRDGDVEGVMRKLDAAAARACGATVRDA